LEMRNPIELRNKTMTELLYSLLYPHFSIATIVCTSLAVLLIVTLYLIAQNQLKANNQHWQETEQ